MNVRLAKLLLTIVVTALIAVTITYYLEKGSEKQLIKEVQTSDSDTSHSNQISDVNDVSGNPIYEHNTKELVTALKSSKSVIESLDIVEKLLDSGKDGLALSLLEDLHTRCGYIEGWEPPYDSTIWAYEKVIDYCKSYDPQLYEAVSETALSLSNPVKYRDFSSLVFDPQKTNIVDISTEFLDMVVETEYLSESVLSDISDTIRYFSDEFGVPLQLGQSDYVNPLEVGDLQNIALDIYSCDRFGGCGPNDFSLWGICAVSSQCQPDWSLMDFYQNTLSPVNFEEVMKIVTVLRGRSP